MGEVKRQSVEYRWDGLNWEFLKGLAKIAYHAADKYDSPEQYTDGRLEGDKSPINHAYEHLRAYIAREPHDHFGDLKAQLWAVAYNCMMEAYYLEHGGPTVTDAFVSAETKRQEFQREQAKAMQAMQNAAQNVYVPLEEPSVMESVRPGLLGLFKRN